MTVRFLLLVTGNAARRKCASGRRRWWNARGSRSRGRLSRRFTSISRSHSGWRNKRLVGLYCSISRASTRRHVQHFPVNFSVRFLWSLNHHVRPWVLFIVRALIYPGKAWSVGMPSFTCSGGTNGTEDLTFRGPGFFHRNLKSF